MAKELKINTGEETNEELSDEIKSAANELVGEAQDLAGEFATDLKNLPNSLKEAAKEELKETKEEIFSEINEAKQELIDGFKETMRDMANTLFGDFQAFLTLFKFTGMWFIKPLAHDVREMKLKASQSATDAQKYFTDVKLMKAMFVFSLLFLAVETTYETGTEGAEEDAWISQFVFLLFYLTFVVVYIGFGWLWQKAISMDVKDSRKFIGFLVYEYATVYFLQFITVAILGLDIENDTMGMVLALFIPFIHMTYFFNLLMKRYEVKGVKKWMGLMLAMVFTSFILLITAAKSHIVVVEGI